MYFYFFFFFMLGKFYLPTSRFTDPFFCHHHSAIQWVFTFRYFIFRIYSFCLRFLVFSFLTSLFSLSIDIDALRIFASFNIWDISEIISIDCLFIWEWIVFSFFSCLFWLYPTHCECFLMFELLLLWVLSFLKQLNWLKNSRLCPSCLGSNTSIVYFSLSWSAWSVPHECLVQQSATAESGAPCALSPFWDFLAHFAVALVALNSILWVFMQQRLQVFCGYFSHPEWGKLGLFPSYQRFFISLG